MKRSERRERAAKKILHRKDLIKKLGLQGGVIYERIERKLWLPQDI